MSEPVKCPACGAELRSLFRGPEMVVCEYCRAMVVLTSGVPTAHGQLPPLLDRPSPFRLRGELTALGTTFELVGRARYAYDGGEWDEWTLRDGQGREARLADDEGDLVLFESLEIFPATALPRVRPGEEASIGALRVRVSELGQASLVGASGSLTRALEPSARFAYIDGYAEGGLVSVRAYADRTEIYRGRPHTAGASTSGWG